MDLNGGVNGKITKSISLSYTLVVLWPFKSMTFSNNVNSHSHNIISARRFI